MTGINLSLPIDIPWTQLATSYDMMDASFGPNGFPPKWRSSLAIFYYDAVDLPDEMQDRRITYFKVVATITGFQTDEINSRHVNFGDLTIWERGTLQDQLNKYFACYGVLLQVAVAPSSEEDRQNLSNYPIIVDFEPKKRDLYEVATDTGEVLSGSSSRAAVQKGFTSTANSESTLGLSATGSYSSGPSGGGGGSITGSFSDKSSFGTQDSSLTQIDFAREKRESQSHSTSITQMYNLLQGYHAGTNRAVFLLSPRPHVLEDVEKRTFINGPREIEGVQEFFFVTSRPTAVENICIEAFLETGHLDLSPAESTTQAKDQTTFDFNFLAPRSIPHGTGLGDDSTSQTLALSSTYTPPDKWEIDTDLGQSGYVLTSVNGTAQYTVTPTASAVTVSAQVVTVYHDVTWPGDNYYTYQDVSGELTIFIRKKKDAAADDVRSTFFITSRYAAGCTGGPMQITAPDQPEYWVSFEYPMRVDPGLFSVSAPTVSRMRLANDLQQTVARTMLESLHALPRYKPGTITFAQSQFAQDRFARVLRRRAEQSGATTPLASVGGISQRTKSKLRSALGHNATIDSVFAIPAAHLQDAAGLDTLDQAVTSRWKLLGIGPRDLPA